MPKVVRESELKDILDSINDIANGTFSIFRSDNMKNRKGLTVSSVARASKDLIMSFPVLCEDSIEPSNAGMVCKAIERKAITMMQLIFSATPITAGNGIDAIKQWHNNMDGSFDSYSLDDYIGVMDNIDRYIEFESFIPTKDRIAMDRDILEATKYIIKENKEKGYSYPTSSLSESSLMRFSVTENGYTGITVKESTYLNERANKPKETNGRMFNKRVDKDDVAVTGSSNPNARVVKASDQSRYNFNKAETEFLTKQILDNDARKYNELVPSLMIVRFYVTDADGKATDIQNQFVAGVKARLIPVDAHEIHEKIYNKNKDKSGFVELVRATTKEIHFVKDYLFALDNAKFDAVKVSRTKTAGIWKTLEKRSTKSVLRRLMGKSNDAGCITTLVVSSNSVEFLKKEYGIDMNSPREVVKFMDAYNLLCFAIVDESIETVKFFFDGDNHFEQVSFNNLERESGDQSYKKVINLISKMNR